MARQFLASGLIICALFYLWLSHEGPDRKEIKIVGSTMGTTYSIVLLDSTEELGKQVKQNANRLLENINAQMSTYIPTSNISMFNSSSSIDWTPIPKEMGLVVQKALDIAKSTNGAYDVTIGPLVNLYGFGPQEKTDLPAPELVASTMQQIGYQHLLLDIDKPALQKTKEKLYLDLSSIAKGYGVDALHDLLVASGFEEFMVEIGGEVRTRSKPNSQKQWRIAIEKPSLSLGQIEQVLKLNNMAMATSGDYRNFKQVEGKKVSHIVDPRNGLPVEHELMSATVIADTCMEADAWATAMLVLGEQEGLELADKMGLKAFFLVRDSSEKGYKAISSKAFVDFLNTNGKIKT